MSQPSPPMLPLSIGQVQKIQQFVTLQKRKRLNAVLGCPAFDPVPQTKGQNEATATSSSSSSKTTSRGFVLKPSTPQAHSLLGLFETKLTLVNTNGTSNTSETQQQPPETAIAKLVSLDELLRACLMINPMYCTPWDALLAAASSLDRLCFADMVECVSSMQEFFGTTLLEQPEAASVLFSRERSEDKSDTIQQQQHQGRKCSQQQQQQKQGHPAESEVSSEDATSSSKSVNSSKSGHTAAAIAMTTSYAKDSTEAKVLEFVELVMRQLVAGVPVDQSAGEDGKTQDDSEDSGTRSAELVVRILSDMVETVLRVTRDIQPTQQQQQQQDEQPRHGLFDVIIEKVLVEIPFENASASNNSTKSQPLLAWLRMVHNCRSLFCNRQLGTMAERLITRCWSVKEGCERINENDFPELLALLLDMAMYTEEDNCNGKKKVKKKDPKNGDTKDNAAVAILWRTAAVYVLYQAFTAGPECFVAAEASFSKSLNEKWTANTIESFIVELPTVLEERNDGRKQTENTAIPKCFALSVLLPCFEALEAKFQSSSDRSLSQLLLQDVSGDSGTQALMDTEGKISSKAFQVFLDYGFGKDVNPNEVEDVLFERIDELEYHGNGSFTLPDGGAEIEALSSCGRALAMTLFLGYERIHPASFGRTLRMIDALESAFFDRSEEQESLCSILRLLLNAVAYYDIPKFRNYLAHQIGSNCVKTDGEVNNQFQNNLSTIAFIISLAENCKSNIDKERHVLLPLCELLEDDNIPLSCLRSMSDIFLNVPEARVMMLDASRRVLAPLYFNAKHGEYIEDGEKKRSARMSFMDDRSKQEPVEENQALFSRIESGMQGLLHLIRTDDWGDTEINAWVILSEALVEDIPFLPYLSRQELYQSIADCEDEFCDDTKEHLLRALVARMSHIFLKPRNCVMECEEIVVVHRLAIKLFRSLGSSNETCEHRLTLLAQGRDAFLRSILAINEGHSEPADHVLKYVKNCFTDSESSKAEGFPLCWAVFLITNLVILDTLSGRDSRAWLLPQTKSVWSKDGLYDLIIQLKLVERDELNGEIANSSSGAHLPSWVKTPDISLHEKEKNVESLLQQQTYQGMSICLTLELLFSGPLPTNLSQEGELLLSWKLIKGTGYLMRQSVRGDSQMHAGGEQFLLDSLTVTNTARAFFSLSSMLVRRALLRDCSLSLAEELFGAIDTYCHALNVVLRDSEDYDCSEILVSLWDLYNAVASEKSSVKIISYLESHLSDDPKAHTTIGGSNFTFLIPLDHSSDVNRVIRKLRVGCLEGLCKSLDSLSASEEYEDAAVISGLVPGMLEALTEDLRMGLGGESGGITSKLYMSYCSLIENCASHVFEQSRSKSLDPTVISLFDKVSSVITGILVGFTLGSAEKFKSTFILGLVTLPSMCRSLQRAGLDILPTDTVPTKTLKQQDSDLIERTFDDCITILSRWATLRDPLSIPWEDIAGRKHVKSPNNSETSVVSLGSHDNGDTRTSRKRAAPRRIRLIDKEVWSWALSSSITGLKQIWLDSHGVIRGVSVSSEGVDRSMVRPSSNWRLFYQHRKIELHRALSQLLRFFQASTDSHDQALLDMLVMNMPSYPRDLLCSVIACVSQVLTEACRHVNGHLNDKEKDKQSFTFPVMESLCCIAAWLSLDERDKSSSSAIIAELSVGVFKWLEMASRKRPPLESSRIRRTDSKEMLGKVSAVAEYVYQLYLALKDLERSLRKCNVDAEFQKVVKVMVLSEDGTSNSHSTQRQTTELLLPKISLKLRLVLKALPREFRERSLPDFPAIRDASLPIRNIAAVSRNRRNNNTAAGRKRGRPAHGPQTWSARLSSFTSSKRPRTAASAMVPPKRISRNPALEAMWALDQEADHLQGGHGARAAAETSGNKRGGRGGGGKRGRYSLYSAAADLEDFITPG